MDEQMKTVLALFSAWMQREGLTEIYASAEEVELARDDDNVFQFYADEDENFVMKLTPRDQAQS